MLPPCLCLYLCCPPLCPSSPATHAPRLSPWHFRGNLIWVCLAFPRIPFGCRLSLPPDTKTNRGRPAKSSKHHWCWPHYLVFAFQTTPAPLHFVFVPFCLISFLDSFTSGSTAPTCAEIHELIGKKGVHTVLYSLYLNSITYREHLTASYVT